MSMIWQKLMTGEAVSYVDIEFVGGAIAAKAGATSGNTTIALNSGLTGGIASAVSDGDLVIAAFATSSVGDKTLAITDGSTAYELIGSELWADDNRDANLRVAYKFVSGDTATTFGPTTATADAGTTAVYVFRGVSQITPLDVAAQGIAQSNTARANPPSITPVTPGAFIVCIGAAGTNAGVQTFTSSDLIDFLTIGSDSTYDSTLGIGHKDDWVSGPFDAAQFGFSTTDSTGFAAAAMSIALRPALA
jgi:hypothetical protein